jgi:anthranilate phosphoribosyltransferase
MTLTATAMDLRAALATVVERKDLSADEMAVVVGRIMDGEATPAQVGALLTALRMKGETVEEVVGAARAMRQRMLRPASSGPLVDMCGTGGDGSGSVNVSTIASFVVAACGVPVAKHGNRAMSSRAGSHDLIEALDLDPAPGPELAARCLVEAQLAFLFAPAYHAATRHAVGPRREIGFRTLFNLLGPLTNPAGARFHVNGVFASERCELLARAHGQLGSERAMVVHGAGGLDEFAPAGATQVAELADGAVRSYLLRPADFGLKEVDPAGLAGGEPADNARLALDTLRGAPGAIRTSVVMTAAAALHVTGNAPELRAAAARAAEALDGGRALAVLERLQRLTPRPAKPA